ncbi:hypothetical protein SAMN05444920_103607 [Nonomuraea solani]|uniref:Neocarzinostatin family protein n=1 Tax=Nonomuraea solani TaxID=1144553 RepID=A0A1H6BTP0_9ACTN|nr:hypothetical protein [Nonomuraea solani]SEG63586.1 hypothetical protein SAMN05444920_103607 [Nonomuraea solani]
MVVATRLLVAAGILVILAGPAQADSASATGPQGQTLTVSEAALDPAGEEITVTGAGFDAAKGIYVAVCLDKGAGQLATPCVGGVDMSGSSGSSKWISSNPPDYGKDLAMPYTDEGGGKGGFSIRLGVKAKDDIGTDCTAAGVKCVVYTRADHTRSADRTQDVRIPLTFSAGGGSTPSPSSSSSSSPSPSVTPTPVATSSSGDVETQIDAKVEQTPTATPTRRAKLAKTGVDVWTATVVGLAVLAGGGMLMYVGRELRAGARR